jgi:hypothetical protein
MKIIKAFLTAAALCSAFPAMAEERVTLGWGRLFANDALGDGKDRWRTGSYQVSVVRGVSFSGELPSRLGALMEYRASSQIVAPASLTTAAPGDRRYGGMLSLGAHSQSEWRGNEISVGADLVVLGPQTGISNFQKFIHNAIDLPEPTVVSNQLGNGFFPTLQAEIGRPFVLNSQVTLRPFAEAQAGVESYVRIGGDLVIGQFGTGAVMVRDTVTGQRYRAVESAHNEGFSLVLGGDLAKVFDSALLPGGEPAVMVDERLRLRAGLHWQAARASVFYGVSYLSREFEAQPEGQLVGAMTLNMKF